MKELSRRQQSILEFIEQFPRSKTTIRRRFGTSSTSSDISSTSVVDYNLKILEGRNLIRRNRNISRGIELVNRTSNSRNVVRIPVIGQIAAGLPIPVPGDLEGPSMPKRSNSGTDSLPTTRRICSHSGSRGFRWSTP